MTPNRALYLSKMDEFEKLLRDEIEFFRVQIKLGKATQKIPYVNSRKEDLKAYKLALRAYTNKVVPKDISKYDDNDNLIAEVYRCGRCNVMIMGSGKFCDQCGCEYDWEGLER